MMWIRDFLEFKSSSFETCSLSSYFQFHNTAAFPIPTFFYARLSLFLNAMSSISIDEKVCQLEICL